MRAHTEIPEVARLSLAVPDNLVIVENHPGAVVIRAARDNFSKARKHCFIRYLAAEGFIPDCYEELSWSVDESLLPGEATHTHRALRHVLLTIGCATLVWLVLMVLCVLHQLPGTIYFSQ